MKMRYRNIARMLILVMILVMIPVYASADTNTLKNENYIHFEAGNDYDLTLTTGDDVYLISNNDLYSFTSEDESVAKVFEDEEGYENWIRLRAIGGGETELLIEDEEGNISVIYLTVKSGKTKKLKDEHIINYDLGNDYNLTVVAGEEHIFSGSYKTKLKSVKSSNTKVAKISLSDESENWAELQTKRAGKTTLTLKDADGVTTKIKLTVKLGKSEVYSSKWIYKNTKNVKIKAENVQKGDVLKLKIGKKTYTKKIKKDALETSIKFKIKKPGFYGKKYKITLNRKGKVVAKESEYVYLSDTVYVGYTKKKVKWLTGWNSPDHKNISAYTEQWCYDWDGDGWTDAYLYFRNGKVSNWQTSE